MATALFTLLTTVSAGATAITFTPPAGFGSLNGYTQGDFTLNGSWYNYYGGGPFMEYYNQSHSITFNNGTFTFNSITLNGLPWDNYNSSGGTLRVDFMGIGGNLIQEATINLAGNNSWQVLALNVSGVHSIYFPATGGFWPRVQGITYDNLAATPEPCTMLLLGSGLAGLGVFRRKFKKI